ncbi:6H3K-A Chain A, Introduction of a methyl group curbs metabolism of pyrido [Aphelenchoides besseyi]|nr:6H3K-A Chain A, Introduction of a methyl group curbs metabolism of pyrido [Aphelenchoides besseyi]
MSTFSFTHSRNESPALVQSDDVIGEESTQPSDMDELNQNSRFPYGYVITIPIEAKKTANNYAITRRLGQGGFSEVRAGRLISNKGCRFAIKIVDLQKPKTQRIGRQAHWEVDLLKQLQNVKYVIKMFESRIVEKDVIFMILEMGGQSLDSMPRIKSANGRAVNSNYMRKRWHQCVKCVSQVHEHEIIHADIKPGNFLRVGNVLKIIDFGCATPLGPLNEAVLRRKCLGTTRFMSPEYLRDRVASKASDVWALGCTLYWILTGMKIWKEARIDLRKTIITKQVDISAITDVDANMLLEKIFNSDRRKRPSCEEILKSKYLTVPEEGRDNKKTK